MTISNDPHCRARNVSRAHGSAVEVVHTVEVENARRVEAIAHCILAEKRQEGEWFDVDKKVAVLAVRAAISAAQELPGHFHPGSVALTVNREDVFGAPFWNRLLVQATVFKLYQGAAIVPLVIYNKSDGMSSLLSTPSGLMVAVWSAAGFLLSMRLMFKIAELSNNFRVPR